MVIKMIEVCDRTGMGVGDMIVELDFMPNGEGIIPTMQSPPVFKIAPARKYIEGSPPPEEPDFFLDKHNSHGRTNMEVVLDVIKNACSENDSGAAIFLFNYGGQVGCPPHFFDTFPEDVIDAFRSAIQDKDFGPLSEKSNPYDLTINVLELMRLGAVPKSMIDILQEDMLYLVAQDTGWLGED
ncbi:unnamed protein product [Cylindrotheca closterium]|uniref:Uncharacterized protein n=1 Tax=Cylindrotheca closterium TaxID=2856 RepID=A0AAD2FCA5_9STRA|nr:unnamed protein product [Cylindrotheca closterium]